MATVTTRVSEIRSGDWFIHNIGDNGFEHEYELTDVVGIGYLKVRLSDVDDLIDVLTTFKKEMSK